MNKLIFRLVALSASSFALHASFFAERPVSSTLFSRETNFNRGYDYGRDWNYRGGDYLASAPGVAYIDSGNPVSSEDLYIS